MTTALLKRASILCLVPMLLLGCSGGGGEEGYEQLTEDYRKAQTELRRKTREHEDMAADFHRVRGMMRHLERSSAHSRARALALENRQMRLELLDLSRVVRVIVRSRNFDRRLRIDVTSALAAAGYHAAESGAVKAVATLNVEVESTGVSAIYRDVETGRTSSHTTGARVSGKIVLVTGEKTTQSSFLGEDSPAFGVTLRNGKLSNEYGLMTQGPDYRAALGKSNFTAALADVLNRGLGVPEPVVYIRLQAKEKLLELGTDVTPYLIQALLGGSIDDSRTAATALCGIRDQRAVPALKEALQTAELVHEFDEYNRARYLCALAGCGGILGLREALAASDPKTRMVAAAALGYYRNKGAANILLKVAGDKTEELDVRGSASYALGLIADPKAVPVLVRLLEEVQKSLNDLPPRRDDLSSALTREQATARKREASLYEAKSATQLALCLIGEPARKLVHGLGQSEDGPTREAAKAVLAKLCSRVADRIAARDEFDIPYEGTIPPSWFTAALKTAGDGDSR
jgi:HEAT repeat protein